MVGRHFYQLMRRLPGIALTLIGAVVVTFIIARLIPADPARLIAGDGASERVIAQIRAEYGLDKPVTTQFVQYLSDLAHGNLGLSLRSGEPVLNELLRVAPATFELALAALILIVLFGMALGSWSALTKDRLSDQLIRALSAIAISTPTFWTAMFFVLVFAAALSWAPLNGRFDPTLPALPQVTGLRTLDALLSGRLDAFGDALAHLILPAATLAFANIGLTTRLVRTAMLDTLTQDYVRRARSAGLSEWKVITAYALPNAMIPFLTATGLMFADLIVGAIITEMIFGWPGLGAYTLEAIAGLDFPAIMGFTVFAALIYAFVNALIDIANGVIDPRGQRP
ncbi:MAG: ABC transporter permease [Alphaproteobacteria bacterium]|nr:ABC transporter permease [Alphaproteobacteria bacterium]